MIRSTLRALGGLALIAALAVAFVYRDRLDPGAVARWFAEPGAATVVVFVLAYALATVLMLPGLVMTLAGGALFGPLLGTLCNLAGATLGASLSFLLARHLAGEWVERRATGWLGRVRAGVEREGWRFVAFTRLVPLFPFNLLNYALGLTRIPFGVYAVTSLVCMLPAAAAYTWLGHLGREAATGAERDVARLLLGLAGVATLLYGGRLIARRMRASRTA